MLKLKCKADLFTLIGHHWNEVAANVRKAQVKGLGLATRNQVPMVSKDIFSDQIEEPVDIQDTDESVMEKEKVAKNYFDTDGRFSKEFGYATPYTMHGGTEEHHHHYPTSASPTTQSQLLPWLLAGIPALALAWYVWNDNKYLVDNTKNMDVEATTTYVPPE